MKDAHPSIDVSILDQTFSIRCPSEQGAKLLESAAYLDQKMREIRSSSQLMNLDRIAVLAALNITYDLLFQEQNTLFDASAVTEMVEGMSDKIKAVLEKSE